MRTVGVAQRALDLMITRVTDSSRKTFGKQLSEHGVVVERVALSRMELDQARLLVLVAAIQVRLTAAAYPGIVLDYLFRSMLRELRVLCEKLELLK